MRVFFNAVAARKGKEGGATLLIYETARSLVENAPQHEYVFCLDSTLEIDLPEEIRRIDAKLRNPYDRVRWDQWIYPELVYREGGDVTVAPLGFSSLRPAVPRITMLPDSTYFCGFAAFGRTRAEKSRVAARRRLLKRVCASSQLVIVPSQAMADGVSSTFGKKAPIELLRYGWNPDPVEPSAKPWDEPVKILYVSQLQPHKAHVLLIKMARELENLDIDFQFRLCVNPADSPRLFRQLREEIRAKNLGDRFEIRSDVSRSEIRDLFGESDCFVYPSLCESFGFPMVEATTAGLPVVAAGTPINREMLGPGAHYYPPLEPEMAAEKIRSLAENGLARASMVTDAQIHQQRILPTWSEYGARLVDAIEKVASR